MLLATARVRAQTPQPVQQIILSGLRWYSHWLEPLSTETNTLECRGRRFDKEYFAYCLPGQLTLELRNGSDGGRPAVRFIAPTEDEYSKALAWFSKRQRMEAQESFHISLNASEVNHYEIDLKNSEAWMEKEKTFMEDIRRRIGGPDRHVAIMFPLVSREDPFYHVYVTEDGRVNSVWEFLVTNGKVEDHSNWVYDQPHRSIREKAQAFAEDARRWYRVVGNAGR